MLQFLSRYFRMRTNILIISLSVVVINALLREDNQKKISFRSNYLRNFYDNREDHERKTEFYLRTRQIEGEKNVFTTNNTVYYEKEHNRIRHKHEERKIKKIRRCRRYAQIYYQNYANNNCYYTICRKSYCGYCPTSSCRRRCPYNCTYAPSVTQEGTKTPTYAPPTQTTKDSIKECKCDKQGSEIQACNQITGNCICKPHYEGSKCDRCEAGYWKDKSICKACNCNSNGSTNSNCDQETGICSCKRGVHGQKCDSCKPKHYGNVTVGCKACEPCEKEGHICHPENGKCVCPMLTTGRKCERCVENAWGHEPGIGCKLCGCSMAGSSTKQCDSIKGRCTCVLGFEGEKCDKCSFGYYGYPNCKKCNCVVAGTRPEDCSHGSCKCSSKGCRCKANVEGKYCERCKKGTFGMVPDHLEGCIDCFCSNRSKTCTASMFIWDQIRTNDVQKVASHECINKLSCWSLPAKFTGDLIQSYGGYLRISSNSPRNYVYLTGNGVTLESVTDSRGDIKMTETYWQLKYDSDPPRMPNECFKFLARPCLMATLQNVSKIHIEPRSFSQNLKFNEILLDKVSNTPGVSQATSVEQCTCPKKYTSSSCQDPNTGYYRVYPNEFEQEYGYIDRMLGVAKPCYCHNRSKVCDKQTGHCLVCGNFTTGPHCESCAEGYYKDSHDNCSPCLCPSEKQNFAKSCNMIGKNPKQFTCVCKRGYSGSNCNKCEDKYWGNPREEKGSCQPCDCNPYGSENLLCDKSTGYCKCKPGFTGEKCSKCAGIRQIIQGGTCIPCDECTQILFYTLDDLSNGLNNTLDIFKNGVEPPWALLNSTVNRYHLLSDKFDNLENAKQLIEDANISDIEDKIKEMKRSLPERNSILYDHTQSIDVMQKASGNITHVLQELDLKIDDMIKNINKFGESHLDVHEALREAKDILDDIISITKEAPTTQYYQNFFNRCEELYQDVQNIYGHNLNLTEINVKLDDLRDRLFKFNAVVDRTDLNNKLVKHKNQLNSKRIHDLSSKINRINETHSIMNKNIAKLLKKIDATNDLLKDMEKIYESLSMLNLEDATKSFDHDNVGQIYETLSAVRKHVKNLQDKIKIYKNIFNFTREEWMKIDASSAYDNIVKDIDLARREANEARNITINALNNLYPSNDDSLPDKTNLAKAFSDRLHKRVINLDNLSEDFKKTTEDLEDLKHDILFNGKSNNELNSYLRDIHKNISKHSEDIDKLQRTKYVARNVSSLIASIEQGIRDTNITMQYELTKTYHKYLDLVSNDKIENLTKSLNSTKKQLEDVVNISLNFTAIDKIKDINVNKFNSSVKNLDTIQQQIDQLNNIIQYANERVEAVEYGVGITKCERYYKVQNDIFRSLEINFNCKTCNLFYLYNSNKESIRLRYENKTIHVTWKDQNKSIDGSTKVSLRRIGSKIRVETENNTIIINDDKPFQIENQHLLQIGDLKNNSSEGCVRNIVLNGKTLGLWRFYSSEGSCPGCYRNTSTDGQDVFFNGEGYRKVIEPVVKILSPTQLNFVFSFATFDENSLIFLAQDKKNQCSFIALNLKDGHLQLKVKHVNGEEVTIDSKHLYNNGVDTKVEIAMVFENGQQMYSLKVLPAKEDPTPKTRNLQRMNVYKIKQSEIFVGGISSTFNKSCLQVNTTPFLGNLNVTGVLRITHQNTLSYNIESRLKNLEFYKAWFSGKGFVHLRHYTKFSQISFSLRPVEIINNFVLNIDNKMDIYLENSRLIFSVDNNQSLIFEPICVNSSNFIIITTTSIRVNDDVKNLSRPLDFSGEKIDLYLGSHTTNKNPRNFSGSIGDIFIDDRPLLFNATTVISFAKVGIGRDEPSTISFKNECVKEMQNTERYLHIPDYKTEPQAFKFGDKPNSFVFIKNTNIGKKCVLEFQFRTFYPNGLLFLSNTHSPNRNTTFYTVLEIQGGDIRLRVQGHRIKAMNIRNKINDGAWHSVQIEQVLGKKKWRLIVKVDKKWKIKERIPRNNFNGDLYVGGVDMNFVVHKKLKNELHPFRGCIRSLKMNRNLQVVKNNNNVFYSNIGQCFQNVEEGAYFGGDAYAIYKYGFKVNKLLELSFEFKTGEPNGILLSVSNSRNSPALSVELQNGAVVMTIDMGNGIVSKVTNTPHSDSTLANNKWHNITALYSSSELTVNVDGVRKSWVQSDINSMIDEIDAPLYVGGLPNNAPSGTLKIKENFKGCIRKFKIEDNIMDWTDMKELNNVQLNSCLA